jgi:hypothetical protein
MPCSPQRASCDGDIGGAGAFSRQTTIAFSWVLCRSARHKQSAAPSKKAREHQLVEQQLQKMLAADDKLSDAWMAQLTELQKLVDTTSSKKKVPRSAARATSSIRTSWRLWGRSSSAAKTS